MSDAPEPAEVASWSADEAEAEDRSPMRWGLGLLAGVVAGAAGSVIWWLVVMASDLQVGLIASAVGWLTGYGVVWGVRVRSPAAGVMAGTLALLAMYFGHTLILTSSMLTLSELNGMPFMALWRFVYSHPALMWEAEVIGLWEMVFAGIGVWAAWELASGWRQARAES